MGSMTVAAILKKSPDTDRSDHRTAARATASGTRRTVVVRRLQRQQNLDLGCLGAADTPDCWFGLW